MLNEIKTVTRFLFINLIHWTKELVECLTWHVTSAPYIVVKLEQYVLNDKHNIFEEALKDTEI